MHGKKECFLEGTNGLDEVKEREANDFAENELIPRKDFAAFTGRPIFSKAAICDFARRTGISPGVVVGQLQYKKLIPPSHCNDLKQTFIWGQ